MKLSRTKAVRAVDNLFYARQESKMGEKHHYPPQASYPDVGSFFPDHKKYMHKDILERIVTKLHPIRNASLPLRYIGSTILVLINLAFHLVTDEAFLFFFPAIILSSLLFNRGTGIYSAILSGVMAYYFLLEPPYSLKFTISNRTYGLVGITIVGVFIAVIIEALRRSLDRQSKAYGYLKESESKYRAIFETAIEAVITFDTSGVIRSANPATEKIFGYTPADLIETRDFLYLLSDQESERLKNYLSDYLRTGRKRIIGIGREVEGKRKDGYVFPLHLSVAEWLDANNEQFFTAILRNISAEKMEKARLEHYMHELEDSNRKLDDFVYIVSHDLKEPVRGIYNFSKFLIEDYGQKLDQEGLKRLETLQVMAKRMQEMIADLLHYSVLTRGKVTFEEVDVSSVINDVLDLQQIQLQSEDIHLKVHDNFPIIMASKAQIAEVFRNLIVNAIKYNDEAVKKVEIGYVTNHPRKPSHPVFFVRDNGIGVPREHKEDIFKIFKRLHGHGAYGGGTGSGLAIVKRVIDQHNGDIWVEAANGKGSIFYFYVDPRPIKS